MSKALDGVTVVEFASHLACAYAAMTLAEQGARTIKIEPKGGAPDRGTAHFQVANRSKQSVFLELDSAAGRADALDLIRLADVVITGFVPWRLRAMGLDYESIHRINPSALQLSMPPMGSCGPLAEVDAENDLVEALAAINGTQASRSGQPVAQVYPSASYQAGLWAAAAAVAALIARDDGGPPQLIEVSTLAGAVALSTGLILRGPKLQRVQAVQSDPLGELPVYRLYEAADGKYLFIACGNPRFWQRLCLMIERPDLISDPRFENAPFGIPAPNRQALKDIIAPVIRTKPREHWLRVFEEHEVPCAPVLTRQEFIEHPQVRHLEMRREVVDPVLGPTIQMGVPVKLRRTPGEIVGPAPALHDTGEMAAQLLREAQLPSAMARAHRRMLDRDPGGATAHWPEPWSWISPDISPVHWVRCSCHSWAPR